MFCVISFLDLYEKTKRNFPAAREVTESEQIHLASRFAEIGAKYGIPIRTCCENVSLAQYGVDVAGCMTKAVLEAAADCRLTAPKRKNLPAHSATAFWGLTLGCITPAPMAACTVMAIATVERLRGM